MNYKKSGTRILSAVLAITLLTGCGIAAGPVSKKTSETTDAAPDVKGGVVKVKNVDEFLAAIAPDTVIELAEGVYDLSTASNYGEDSGSDYYSWNTEVVAEAHEVDAELIIHDVNGLTIRGAGIEDTTVAAVPRYANVIKFEGCKNITVSDLTAGHTKEPGFCSGGVIFLENCSEINVDTCGLYGCGTIGVYGFGCEKLNITNCDIYECSEGAVDVAYCTEVLVSGCDIHDIGVKSDYAAYNLFEVNSGSGFTVYNCKVHNNKAQGLLYANEAENVSFLSNEVTKNVFSSGAFNFITKGATVDGCSFEDNNCKNWYGAGSNRKASDIDGNIIEADQFTSMKYRDIEPDKVVQRTETVPTGNAKDVPAGTEVEVTTVDEFLEVIGPDRTIVLDGTNFDLTKAKDYGGIGTEFYSWEETYDGPQLVIHDVKNLTIKAKDSDPAATTLEALPRYANVLVFKNCGNVTVEGFTAGHTKEQGACSGGVIYFSECESSRVENMRLYGCGVTGVDAFMCTGVDVINTEIYECSYGAVYFSMTSDINFKNCNIHDVPSPALTFSDCKNITWNDQNLEGDELRYDVEHDGTLVVWAST